VCVCLRNFRGDLIQQDRFFYFVSELGSKDFGERFDGEIEVGSGGMPAAIGSRERAAGDDVMDMRMGVEGSSPSVKHSKEARQISTEVMLIGGKFFDGLRRGLKQGRVSGALVFAHQGAQVLRHREGEKEMVSGELAVDLFF